MRVSTVTFGSKNEGTPDSLSWTRFDKVKPAERFAYSRKNAAQMTVEWFVAKPNGELVLGDSLDCTRTPS